MGLCSVAGMLELQETLDFLIFQVLSLIIGSTLRDSKNKWTLALSLESLDRLVLTSWSAAEVHRKFSESSTDLKNEEKFYSNFLMPPIQN